MMRSLSLLLPLVAALPAQQASSALDDYRGGRHRAAFDVFQAELLAGGERAPLELRWNTALAALRLQRPADAEAAITPLLTPRPAGSTRRRRPVDSPSVGSPTVFPGSGMLCRPIYSVPG